jgi:hypothetical protein
MLQEDAYMLPSVSLGGGHQELLPVPVPRSHPGVLLESHHTVTRLPGPGDPTTTSPWPNRYRSVALLSHHAGRMRRVSSGCASYVATTVLPKCAWGRRMQCDGIWTSGGWSCTPERSLKGFPPLSISALFLRGARLTVAQHLRCHSTFITSMLRILQPQARV